MTWFLSYLPKSFLFFMTISKTHFGLYLQIWNCVMSAVEWNKKEDLLQEQALRHLKQYTTLFAAFATNYKSELVLLNKVQEYCYDNMNFIKTFNKIVLLFYKSKFFSNKGKTMY